MKMMCSLTPATEVLQPWNAVSEAAADTLLQASAETGGSLNATTNFGHCQGTERFTRTFLFGQNLCHNSLSVQTSFKQHCN